jgi:hypothetical protein
MSSTLIRLRRTDSDQRAMCAHGKSFKCQAECSGSGRIEPPGLVCVRSAGSSFSSVRIQKNVSSRKFRPRRSVIGSARCMSLLPKSECLCFDRATVPGPLRGCSGFRFSCIVGDFQYHVRVPRKTGWTGIVSSAAMRVFSIFQSNLFCWTSKRSQLLLEVRSVD